MSNKIIYWVIGFIVVASCKEQKISTTIQESVYKVIKKDINVSPDNNKTDSLKEFSLPFGNELILTDFPKKWKTPLEDDIDEKKDKHEIILDSIYNNLNNFMYDNSLKIDRDTINFLTSSVSMYFKYYEDYTHHNYTHKIKKNITIPIGKIVNFEKDINLVLTLDSNPRGPNYLNIVTLNSKKHIIDGVNIGYSKNVREFSHSGKYFFIDKNKIIHIKYFLALDGETRFQRYEKYQIFPNGKIVRYFNKDSGEFSNSEEKGNIKNHTKQGVWIETKPNMYIEEFTYTEAKYKKGLPFGTWNYYNLIDNIKKGNNLLMTEEYDSNGKLLKRVILKK